MVASIHVDHPLHDLLDLGASGKKHAVMSSFSTSRVLLHSPWNRGLVLVGVLLGALLVGGCRSSGPKPGSPRAYNIDVKPEGGVERMSVAVYVGPANALEGSVDDLIARLRANPKSDPSIVTYSVTGNPGTKRLVSQKSTEDRAQWKAWLKGLRTDRLAVVADLPGVGPSAAGGSDPRREILPLGKKCWPPLRDDALVIRVFPDRVDLDPKPFPWSIR